MIVASIRKLGFKPEDIKIMINGHAHIDHAGAFAYFKEQFGDPEGYRRFIAGKKRAFEDQIDLELGVKKSTR